MKSEYLNQNHICKRFSLCNVFTLESDFEMKSEYLNKSILCIIFYHWNLFTWWWDIEMKIEYWTRTNNAKYFIFTIPLQYLYNTFTMSLHDDQILKWIVNNKTRINFPTDFIFVRSLYNDQRLKWRVNIWIWTNTA
jgi:hypothetical protein